jgi:hypothetical protein
MRLPVDRLERPPLAAARGGVMLPKFKIRKHEEYTPPRFSVETDWFKDDPDHPNVRQVLLLTTGGRLATSGVTWGTRERAEAAIKQCKARLAF